MKTGKVTRRPLCSMTGIAKDFCAHCRNPRGGVVPGFGLWEGYYKGNPIVEILKDGGPIHPHDEHFRFGTTKARLILGALRVIRAFANSTSLSGVTLMRSQVVRSELPDDEILISVELKPDFVRSPDKTIQRPWLQLQAYSYEGNVKIGLGVTKAEAVCAVSTALRRWYDKVSQLH